jgi:hypothetical protein
MNRSEYPKFIGHSTPPWQSVPEGTPDAYQFIQKNEQGTGGVYQKDVEGRKISVCVALSDIAAGPSSVQETIATLRDVLHRLNDRVDYICAKSLTTMVITWREWESLKDLSMEAQAALDYTNPDNDL